jgi:S-disulfanyl-L-cysteine oxidoreductase SoxD
MRRLAMLLALISLGWEGFIMAPSFVQAEDQVARGQVVYQERCASCHGEQGEGKVGRALIGSSAGLGGYGTARGLFDYVRKVMPADAPGRLTESEYWAVLAYILAQNGQLPPGTTLSRETAAHIPIQP